jgi:hypothetical protein
MPRRKQSAIKRIRKTAKKSLRTLKRIRSTLRKNKKRRQVQARKKQREIQRARTQIDLTGTADISGASVRQAGGDPGASKPGEPPKMRTGKGRSSIKAQLRVKGKKLASRVYVDKKVAGYMALWEFRSDGKGRPFLKPSVEDNAGSFGKIIGTELKQANRGGKKKAVVR